LTPAAFWWLSLTAEPSQSTGSFSQEKLQIWQKDQDADFLVITGYIASTRDGVATT